MNIWCFSKQRLKDKTIKITSSMLTRENKMQHSILNVILLIKLLCKYHLNWLTYFEKFLNHLLIFLKILICWAFSLDLLLFISSYVHTIQCPLYIRLYIWLYFFYYTKRWVFSVVKHETLIAFCTVIFIHSASQTLRP